MILSFSCQSPHLRDIAEGLRNGTIKIRYRVVKAPGDGTASVADLFIDNSRIDYSFAGG